MILFSNDMIPKQKEQTYQKTLRNYKEHKVGSCTADI